jgi:two-component system, OmpR family, response regulator VicR
MEKILIVEDEKTLNEAYQMILKRKGYEVHTAFDGKEAIEITEEIEPDLILLDLRMPKMGGLDFLKQYNLVKKHPDVRVVVFSNMDTKEEIDEAYELGATKYMLKAWASPQELLKLVEEVLKQDARQSN